MSLKSPPKAPDGRRCAGADTHKGTPTHTQNAAHTKCTHLAAPDTKVGGRQGGGQGQEVGVKQGEVEDGGVGPRGVLLVVQVPVEVEGHVLWIHGVHHRVGCDRDGDVRRGAAAHDNNQKAAHETCKHDFFP